MKRLVVLALLLFPTAVLAQKPADFERILVPVHNAPAPGAFGSIWTTELWVHNSGSAPVSIRYPECHVSACNPVFEVEAGATIQPPVWKLVPGERAGLLLWVPCERANAVHFTLRAQDLSRQSQTWGTEVPVVRDGEFLTTTAHLLNIPTTDAFRQTLRIYDAESRSEAAFLVNVYDQSSNALIGSRTYVTTGHGNPPPDYAMPNQPGSVEIGPFADAFGVPATTTRIRLEVTPLTAGVRFWTLMSVTNNETQHVTLITPQ